MGWRRLRAGLEGRQPAGVDGRDDGAPARGRVGLEGLAAAGFLLALIPVMANVVPFWNGMAALLSLGALTTTRWRGLPRPSWGDMLGGTLLGVLTWGAVRLLLPTVLGFVPGLADGFTLVAGYARQQPLAWAYVGMAMIATGEELVWRWYLPWRLGGGYRAAALAAVPYAAMHLFTGTFYLVPSAFGFGLLWGLATAWRGGPWLAIMWHLVFDWLVFLAAPPRGI